MSWLFIVYSLCCAFLELFRLDFLNSVTSKIIEVTGIELQKLRISLLKLQEQNLQLAQANSQMSAVRFLYLFSNSWCSFFLGYICLLMTYVGSW